MICVPYIPKYGNVRRTFPPGAFINFSLDMEKYRHDKKIKTEQNKIGYAVTCNVIIQSFSKREAMLISINLLK